MRPSIRRYLNEQGESSMRYAPACPSSEHVLLQTLSRKITDLQEHIREKLKHYGELYREGNPFIERALHELQKIEQEFLVCGKDGIKKDAEYRKISMALGVELGEYADVRTQLQQIFCVHAELKRKRKSLRRSFRGYQSN